MSSAGNKNKRLLHRFLGRTALVINKINIQKGRWRHMDKKTVVSILEFYKNIDEEISLKKQAQDRLKERYYSPIGCIAYDGMPKGKGRSVSPTESAVLNVPEWAAREMAELQQEQQALYQVKKAIRQELSKLPYKQKAIIFMFYLEGLKWVQISARIHYSERQCRNIRRGALAVLGRRFSANKIIAAYIFPEQ